MNKNRSQNSMSFYPIIFSAIRVIMVKIYKQSRLNVFSQIDNIFLSDQQRRVIKGCHS